MADVKLSFSTVGERLQTFLIQHRIPLEDRLYSEFLDFLSKACTYEEENKKIKPSLIVGSGLTQDSFVKIAQATVIPFIKEEIAHTCVGKRLKSILPFCNNGWRVFISVDSDAIVYG
ncbi:MAG: hypothetical protein K2H43_00910, partial [Clostridia bacterium]|nr:hypothetical protein [Clostridia bacterium]